MSKSGDRNKFHSPRLFIGSLADFESWFSKINKKTGEAKFLKYLKFGIDDAHNLIRLLNEAGEDRVFVIVISSITPEAQNALLKATEEINNSSGLYFVVNNDQQLLSTLKSRFDVVSFGDTPSIQEEIDPDDFLSSSRASRLKMIEKFIKHPDEEEDQEKAKVFLRAFSRELYERLSKKQNLEGIKVLEEVVEVQGMTAPSYRLIYESLALMLPTLK